METQNTSKDSENTKKADRLSILIAKDINEIDDCKSTILSRPVPDKILSTEAAAPSNEAPKLSKLTKRLQELCSFLNINTKDIEALSK
jgi:hypothetical protein